MQSRRENDFDLYMVYQYSQGVRNVLAHVMAASFKIGATDSQ